MADSFDGDLIVQGRVQARGGLYSGDDTITDDMISPTAGIQATKVQQQKTFRHKQPNTTATTETVPLFVAYGATGTLVSIKAGTIAACVGAATITIDLKKNGTTVLSSVITLDNANTARVVEAGTLSVTAYVTGDWFDLVITATAGGGTLGTGLLVEVVTTEDPA